jgi:hypothetical protein
MVCIRRYIYVRMSHKILTNFVFNLNKINVQNIEILNRISTMGNMRLI